MKKTCQSIKSALARSHLSCGRFSFILRPHSEIYHKLLVTAHLKSGKRGAYLRANLDRAKLHKLRQYRYIRFLKTDWIKRLRMPILPYPKRQSE